LFIINFIFISSILKRVSYGVTAVVAKGQFLSYVCTWCDSQGCFMASIHPWESSL